MSSEQMVWFWLWIRFECLTAYVMNVMIAMRLSYWLAQFCPFIFCAFFDQPIGR